jgi:hypothetical protein
MAIMASTRGKSLALMRASATTRSELMEGVRGMKRTGTRWQALALVAGLVLSLEAVAQEEDIVGGQSTSRNFGNVGQIVISSDFYGSMGYSSGAEAFFIELNPSVDYFLKENLSLGGSVLLATAISDGDDSLSVGLRVRAGYNVWLSDKVSVWPQLGLGVGHTGASDNTYLEIALNSPFLVHLAPHFFVGGGPGLITQIGGDTTATLQVSTVVGGYF